MIRHILFGYHPDWLGQIAAYIDHRRFQPSFAPFDHVDLSQYDLVVPLRIDQYVCVRDADAPVRATVPSSPLVALCDDKLALACWMRDNGFGAILPAFQTATRAYPHVRKARFGEFGLGTHIVHGPWDEVEDGDSHFRQQAVPGRLEYALHLLRIGGRVRYARCYRYDMGQALGVRGAALTPLDCQPVDPGPALAPCVELLAALDYEGLCCINYKIDRGVLRVLEINPRFGGSLVEDVTAYVTAHLHALDG